MPIYEYRCRACRHEFERLKKMNDPPETACPVCGGVVDRLVSTTSFTLKGGGWYKDGYASKKPESAAKEAKKEAADTPKKEEKKSEKKA